MQTRHFLLEQRSRRCSLTVTLLLVAALLNINTAAGRPDVRQSPFSLELQPPLAEATPQDFERAIDSYGNPIDALRPIDTPDGRKVISAQGVQFEIPNYASGITEIRKPADDLLPPHIGELTTTTTKRTTTTTRGTAAAAADATSGATTTTKTKQTHKRNTSTTNSTTSFSFTSTTTTTRTTTPTRTTTTPTHVEPSLIPSSKPGQQYVIVPASPKHAPPTFTLLTLNPEAPPSAYDASSKPNRSKSLKNLDANTNSTPNPNPSIQLDAIAVADYSDSTTTDSYAPPAPLTPPQNHETSSSDTSTTSVEVEQAHLEESAQEPQLLLGGALPDYLLELQQQDKHIAGPVPWTPAPDGAPLSVIAWDLLPPFEPQIITEQQPTKHVVGVEQPGSHNIRVSLSSGQGLSPLAPAPLTSGQVAVVPLERDGPAAHGTNAHVGSTTPANGGRFPNRYRGTAHYSTAPTTQRPRSTTTATTTTTTTTTTPKPTTTTTRRTTTTTTRPTTTTTRTTTTAKPPRSTTPLDPSTIYKLDNAEEYAYTLPPWLQEVTDPDLDVAVTFVVPTDNDQYNHSLSDDLEPPFEPFVDLHNLQLTPPPTSERPSTTTTSTTTTTTTTPRTTTTTTTTTRRPSVTAPPTTIFKAQTTPTKRQQPITSTTQKPTDPTKTTTTTAAAAVPVEPNPFDSATLPPWLQDFDYPDVGPGVPYNPDNFKDTGDGDGAQKAGGTKPNDFQPHGFAINPPSRSQATTTTTAPPTTTTRTTTTTTEFDSSAFPSKVTLTLPGSNNNDAEELNTVEPPLVLIPPTVVLEPQQQQPTSFNSRSSSGTSIQQTTTNSITNFAAPFDTQDAVQQPNQQQFPPFSANPTVDTQKVEYTKSDEGKVISTPINNQRKDTQDNSVLQGPSTTAFLPTPTTPSPSSNTGKYTGGFGAPAGLLRPHNAGKPDIYVAGDAHDFSSNVNKINRGRPAAPSVGGSGGRYTGGFGAPGGVLSPQNAPRPFQQAQPAAAQATPQLVAAASSQVSKQNNRFGGPPGILVPFDNVQRTGGQ